MSAASKTQAPGLETPTSDLLLENANLRVLLAMERARFKIASDQLDRITADYESVVDMLERAIGLLKQANDNAAVWALEARMPLGGMMQ